MQALSYLGMYYIEWKGIMEKDYNLAIKYCCDDGDKQNLKKGIELLKKGVDKGDTPSQFSLGNQYYESKGVKKDISEAARL